MRTGYEQKCTRLPVGRNRLPIEKEATELPSQGCFMRVCFRMCRCGVYGCVKGLSVVPLGAGDSFFCVQKTNAKLVFVPHKSVFLF